MQGHVVLPLADPTDTLFLSTFVADEALHRTILRRRAQAPPEEH